MGNKNASPHKGPDAGTSLKEEGASADAATGGVPGGGPPGPSPELLASLQSLGEDSDFTLLPQSLHQIAESYSLNGDYLWAVQFLQLEKLYHERLLSNLTTLQENWESQWRERNNTESCLPTEADSTGQEYIETLSQVCRTHQRPSLSVEKSTPNNQTAGQCDNNQTATSAKKDCESIATQQGEEEEEEEEEEQSLSTGSEPSPRHTGRQEGEEELCEETPEEEVKVEWPAGVPQASAKDLVKLSHTEGSSSPDGLVSILKRRRASLDGLPPTGPPATKHISKRKVRFSEPDDGMEQDEVGGDSCLILLLLCLVTVVISIGGTALYCTLVDTYSNICTDFSHNVDFYVMNVRRVFDELRHWLPLRT
ncbi:consortin, connexin sorting protein b [Polymixia lowei]